ncbi:MAG: hypothetical protein HY318_04285 [Armatimonadetes bacterium]|nr:hypothetical protein [Armatimonadota bacterium]
MVEDCSENVLIEQTAIEQPDGGGPLTKATSWVGRFPATERSLDRRGDSYLQV